MKRNTWIAMATGAAALAALVAFGLRGEARLVTLAEVRSGPFAVTFQEEGRTRLRDRYTVAAPVAGSVRRVELEQGDAVDAGQVVATLEPSATGLLDPASRTRARAESQAAASALAAAAQMIAAAQSAERVARREHERLAAMKAESAVSAQQLDAALARAEQARAELAAARAEHRMAIEKRTAADAVLAQEGAAGAANVLELAAPVAGRVIRRFQESAGPVAAGQPLLEIGNPGALEIEVEALSTDAVKVRPGMRARVLRWGGEADLEAEVVRVEPGGFTKVSALGVEEQRVRVILDLTSPPDAWQGLGDAFRVEVEFVLWEGADVLQVPTSALFRSGGQWAVFVDDGGRAKRVAVGIGARGGLATEVREGLKAGDRVISHPDDRIVDGVRVAPM